MAKDKIIANKKMAAAIGLFPTVEIIQRSKKAE